ncbi:type I DNA topoisomerase [candidate division WWE3 bacterium CG09_land_8_20_14_0_10_39_24]|uniref:DNA topoisomerase 1 n=2 Tax=Katanobacteria TaxID=422282 RepID=A0A2G9XCP0_UNCKA|nr:MAG: DNA topoisomerase I [bacterium CG2_30_40_12]OJI09334.1 MAG: DNA topoisomerase I [bacterium CG09_39_24]PIP04745.1 MAG: DNA topoisomerase I [candidate division WWE3 bacterium CG23_combo_of_CG06-09_8_20_14_all_40_14]PIS13036.1 MAG: type I DNA topoisomerase [candidate division WWE3 bacterium CG09_land_8_20_14_0_10_39_24]
MNEMSKYLVIVESPSKSKTLEKYLGKEYKVAASMGHIRDLPKSKLGVDTENNFAETYEISPSKKKTISALKKLVKEAKTVFLATDPDREGEAISWHLSQVLEGPAHIPLPFLRVSFHEITKDAVLSAFENPRELDMHLVNAQRARRILDRLVGYKLSPLLWKKIRYGLSAGRVQSPAVRFVVERQNEIDTFKSEKFYEVITGVSLKRDTPGLVLTAKLTHIDNVPIYGNKKYKLFAGEYTTSGTTLSNKDQVGVITSDLEKSSYKIASIDKKEYQKAPKPPFATSSLQQEASWRLGFSPKKTMSCAQKLYEAGLITYMRTDSVNLSVTAIDAIRALIAKKYGKDYLPSNPRFYKTKVKVAQEAHEAIRPTNVQVTKDSIKSAKILADELKLYEVIWQRTVVCQMSNVVYSSVNVGITASLDITNYTLYAKDSVVKFPGWLVCYSGGKAGKSFSAAESSPVFGLLAVGQIINFVSLNVLDKQTPPPPYYNEASLIKELEKFGIGRPSTYAPIMSTIQERGYVQKIEGKLKPTDAGIVVTKLLTDNFSDIVDVNFTANMEDELDDIALAKKNILSVINDFYIPFEALLNKKHTDIDKSNYTILETLDEKCPKCHSPLVVKLGRFGRFISCGAYPKCEYLRSIVETVGIKCPKCKEGDVIVRRTKKGKIFYGCGNYPKCDFAVWKLSDIGRG